MEDIRKMLTNIQEICSNPNPALEPIASLAQEILSASPDVIDFDSERIIFEITEFEIYAEVAATWYYGAEGIKQRVAQIRRRIFAK